MPYIAFITSTASNNETLQEDIMDDYYIVPHAGMFDLHNRVEVYYPEYDLVPDQSEYPYNLTLSPRSSATT